MVMGPMALATVLAMVMPFPPMATLATPLATVLMAVVFTSVRLMLRLPTMEAMVLDPMALDMELATVLAMVMPSPPMATLDTPLATVLMALDMELATDLAMVMPSPPMATLATPLAMVLMAVDFTSVRLMPRLPTTEATV